MRTRVLPAAFAVLALWASAARAQPAADLGQFADVVSSGDVAAAAEMARTFLLVSAADLRLSPQEHRAFRAQLADTLAEAGDLEGALSEYEAILNEQQAAYGEEALELLDTLARLTELEVEAGDFESADAYNDRAIAIAQAALGADNPRLAALIETRADVTSQRLDELSSSGRALGPEASQLEVALQDRLRSSEIRRAELTQVIASRRAPPADRGALGVQTDEVDEDVPAFELIPVFYGTSRARSGRRDPGRYYSGDRAVTRGLETGIVTVSVPHRRELGAIPKPSLWRGEFRPDPDRHVIVEDIQVLPEVEEFIARLRDTLDRSERREAFVFIHGYNTDFGDAAERTAQLAADLELDGAPIFYSWPSRGDLLSYLVDSGSLIRPVVDDLETFLTMVANEVDTDRLHVVAHSMGNRYLIAALEQVNERRRRGRPLFDEIVFAAPDMDAADFAARISDVSRLAGRMTLYASEKDRALQLSAYLHGGYRRAGDASQPLVVDGMDTVDTSPAPGPAFELRHEDVFEYAIDDFRSVVWFSLTPQIRCILDERDLGVGVVWDYSLPHPDVCDADIYNAAIVSLRRLGRQQTVQLMENQVELTTNANDVESAERWQAILGVVRSIADDVR